MLWEELHVIRSVKRHNLAMELSRRRFAQAVAGAPLIRSAVSGAEVTPEARRSWLRDARFGMFIHFGLYATLERGEWVMHTEGTPPAEYQKRIAAFNPSQFDARAWGGLRFRP